MTAPRGKVLVVSYNPDERELYATALTLAGFQTVAVADVRDALARVKAEHPVAVVTRRWQPESDVDGFDLTRQIKADPATARACVVMLVSWPQPELREEAVAAGCDHYFLLPTLPEDLVRVVADATDQQAHDRYL